METSGISGKINISSITYEIVKKYFDCKYSGKVKAKNKGKVDMYFVKGIKAKYSIDGEGKIPNFRFKRSYLKLKNLELPEV